MEHPAMLIKNQVEQPTKTQMDFTLEELPTIHVSLLDRRITCMTLPNIIKEIHTACIERRKITVAHYNVHGFNLSMQLPWFYDFLQGADIAHCDGSGILIALRYLGLNLPIQYRVSYTNLMPELLKHCDREHFSIFLLGSKPQSLEVALNHLRGQYPNINFAGHHGYFDQEAAAQNEAIIQQINLMKPNILIVGMGMPIQENWIRQHCNHLHVNAILVGGAVIDRSAGTIPDCPTWIANIGLEWLYRLCHEPKRLAARYLLGNSAFLLHLALAKSYSNPKSILKIS